MDRYKRQIQLKDFGPEAQQRLSNAKVLVVGLGGLGVPVVQYLNAMGVGTLGLVDGDRVDLTNLHRQVLYGEGDVDRPKVEVALEKLRAQNSTTTLNAYPTFLSPENALEIIAPYDIVVDASDNFPTRYLVNDACMLLKKPFVYGALHGWEGQLSVFNYQNGPSYRDLFPTMPSPEEIPDCNTHGTLGIIPGIVGSLQALETVKALLLKDEVLSGYILLYNGLENTSRKLKFQKNPQIPIIESLQKSYEWNCGIVQQITSVELQELLEKTTGVQLIDVRNPDEFSQYHLESSINIPLALLRDQQSLLNPEEPIYFICQSGKRSQQAAVLAQDIFPDSQCHSLSGGLDQYRLQPT